MSRGSVGGPDTARLLVDLVQFVAKERKDGPSLDHVLVPVILVRATNDVYLSLRGIDRIPVDQHVTASWNIAATEMTIPVETAPGQVAQLHP